MPTFSRALFIWHPSMPLPCPPQTQHLATSTPMATSLRRPSFTTCSSSATNEDDKDVCCTFKDASMCKWYLLGVGLGAHFTAGQRRGWGPGLGGRRACVSKGALSRQRVPDNSWDICESLLRAETYLLNSSLANLLCAWHTVQAWGYSD